MPERKLVETFGPGPVSIVRAPGRVNLIGDHTDYNGGYVLPAAVDCDVRIAFRPSNDGRVEIVSMDLNDRIIFDLAGIAPVPERTWGKYPMGVAQALQAEKYTVKGMRAVLKSGVPIGAGLGSSAAVEVATVMALCSVSGLRIHREKLARICQRAESEFVGAPCGIMDQYVCLLGRKGCALFLDCTTGDYEATPFDERQAKIVVCDTKVSRQLGSTPYERRRQECREAFAILRRHFPDAKSWRDITIPMFKAYSQDLPDPLLKRARHVVTENARVIQAARALKKGDFIAFGALMDASHNSLRNDFEASCRELDLLVGIARESEGVYGSRMTGAGFGGCAVALVRPDCADAFIGKVLAEYKQETGIAPGLCVFHPSEGATYLDDANPSRDVASGDPACGVEKARDHD